MDYTTTVTLLGIIIWITLGCAYLSAVEMLTPAQHLKGDRLATDIVRANPTVFAAVFSLVIVVLLAVWPIVLLWGIVTFDYPYWFHRLTSHPTRECTPQEIADQPSRHFED